ncbi:unnamed protein product [Brachionus calyciflorus]|uniref:GDP-Man:Man(3)GlcNAc(2)-PP-Dol alpha-1,2-mannosyltransferase n=1 Tax=Brachionus calyciflorus TaxID=104777 RepID=A0A813SRI4_9BILA|nr:unnamed protein product [Brachionus calyciflorus]
MILLLLNLGLLCLLLKLTSFLIKKLSKNKFSKFANLNDEKNPYFTVGFLHPFCNSGGGGERVLWSAIKALQDAYPNCICVVYTGDKVDSPDEFIKKANDRFNIQLSPTRTQFVYLKFRFLVLDKYYPVFTLLGQSLGSMLLGVEAFLKFIPDVYFETTGYAFTYPLFHYLANVAVCCYTHYPTISTDMLENVSRQVSTYNNRRLISQSQILTKAKMIYYKIFANIYSYCGRCSDCVMVNSSWTKGHINNLWSLAYRTQVVYPPCDVKKFDAIFNNEKHDKNFYISSVAQFRPEKNHQLQIRALGKFLQKLNELNTPKEEIEKVRLLLIGSCRDQDDQNRVDNLRALARELNIEDKVDFKLNFSFDNLLINLAESAVGIHSMIDEHFGIGVVECMAAGTVMLSHNSAGPKMDIVVPYKGEKTGFLAEDADGYAECLLQIYQMSHKKRNQIREAAREHVQKFSQEKFNENFLDAFNNFCYTKFIFNAEKRD